MNVYRDRKKKSKSRDAIKKYMGNLYQVIENNPLHIVETRSVPRIEKRHVAETRAMDKVKEEEIKRQQLFRAHQKRSQAKKIPRNTSAASIEP